MGFFFLKLSCILLYFPKQWIWKLYTRVCRETSFGIYGGFDFHSVHNILLYSWSICSYCQSLFCYSRWHLENCVRQGYNFITVPNTGDSAFSWSKLFFTLISKIKGIKQDRRPCSNLRWYVHIILGVCLSQQVTSGSLWLCILD